MSQIGRNDPCPCNSGKKFKKCCLLQMDELRQSSNREWEDWFKKDLEIGRQNLMATFDTSIFSEKPIRE